MSACSSSYRSRSGGTSQPPENVREPRLGLIERVDGFAHRLLCRAQRVEVDGAISQPEVVVVDLCHTGRRGGGQRVTFVGHGLHRGHLLAGDRHGPHRSRPPRVHGIGHVAERGLGRVELRDRVRSIAVLDGVEPGLSLVHRSLDLVASLEARDDCETDEHERDGTDRQRAPTHDRAAPIGRRPVRGDEQRHDRGEGDEARRAVEAEVAQPQQGLHSKAGHERARDPRFAIEHGAGKGDRQRADRAGEGEGAGARHRSDARQHQPGPAAAVGTRERDQSSERAGQDKISRTPRSWMSAGCRADGAGQHDQRPDPGRHDRRSLPPNECRVGTGRIAAMDFELPQDLADYLDELDDFIEREIKPLEQENDNIRFFDHRREDARTDWERGGLPNDEWEALLREARRRADAAGHYRYPFPKEYGGKDGTNLGMAVIREHLARKGLGLHCDLQNEHSIVGNNVGLLLMINYGTDEQKAEWIDDLAEGRRGFAFGITEPEHGSDATHMETHAVRDGDEWIINGEKTWNTGIHAAQYDLIFARTSGKAGDGDGITAFLVPTNSPGFEIVEFLWTFNMPTDHAHIRLTDVRVPHSVDLRRRGPRACRSCSTSSTRTASARPRRASAPRSSASTRRSSTRRCARRSASRCRQNQAIQFPLVELQTQCEMLRALIHKTAWSMDEYGAFSVSDKVSMCNYWANRLCCEAADRAMQVHGGLGYSRHKPFEHIYRHHRRYRITEGSEEIQMRRVAGYLFGFMKQQAPKGVASVTG